MVFGTVKLECQNTPENPNVTFLEVFWEEGYFKWEKKIYNSLGKVLISCLKWFAKHNFFIY